MRESSEVLARKYRPSNFDELIGQETIAQTLSLALDASRLSHAYLFSGLRGSGKTSTARIFAKALICEKGISHNPCGVCQNCILASQNRHIDIVEMDAASSRKIDDIRDLIEQTKYKPSSARFKIFIIDEVHMLTKEAFNALLKTLEEPPSYVKFILATTDPLKLPATILSRTQHFRFKSIATKKVVDHLVHILNLEKIEYEINALEILARSGAGSLRDTLTLLDQAIIYSKNHIDVATVTDMLGLVDPNFITELFQAVFAKDFETIIKYTKMLEDYESEMVVDEIIAYLKEKLYQQDPLFSTLILDRFFRILSDSKYLFSINADGGFVLSMIFFKMVEALKIKEIDQMIESMEKNLPKAEPILSKKTEPIIEKVEVQQTIVHTPKVIEDKPTPIPTVDKSLELFEQLKTKIQDRNYDLSKCFNKSVEFVSFNNDTLIWESCADEECKQVLKHGYGVIKHFVREVYGFDTKIKGLPCSKTIQQEIPKIKPEPQMQQSASMIEDIETYSDNNSCIADALNINNIQQEIEPSKIEETPLVQKAIELFQVKKMRVQSKS